VLPLLDYTVLRGQSDSNTLGHLCCVLLSVCSQTWLPDHEKEQKWSLVINLLPLYGFLFVLLLPCHSPYLLQDLHHPDAGLRCGKIKLNSGVIPAFIFAALGPILQSGCCQVLSFVLRKRKDAKHKEH